MNGWQQITCHEADDLLHGAAALVLAGRTTQDELFRLWGDLDGVPVLRETFSKDSDHCQHFAHLASEQALIEAANVMALLQAYRGEIVSHLLDTDDNSGERLRRALDDLGIKPTIKGPE